MFGGGGTGLEKHKVGSIIREDIMKLRYKILYMSFGAGLVVLGMVLNSLVSDDADAQDSGLDMDFRNITCQDIEIIEQATEM